MNDPIPISKGDPTPDAERVRHQRRLGWAMFGLLAFIVVGFLTPLIVWLTRLALGG